MHGATTSALNPSADPHNRLVAGARRSCVRFWSEHPPLSCQMASPVSALASARPLGIVEIPIIAIPALPAEPFALTRRRGARQRPTYGVGAHVFDLSACPIVNLSEHSTCPSHAALLPPVAALTELSHEDRANALKCWRDGSAARSFPVPRLSKGQRPRSAGAVKH